ncbi:acyl-CoA carboxylase subunit beta [Corynebacterium sp. c6VSa_13]|uniref:acyl-CoA carboxylase subunit beta n=1 Tax=Corynebacterium sp. c6VSa_13 TaxID=2913496 RepID=UPI0022BA2F7F|nr:carboxyl transferase domain-containing protein [Corynebacterium sp. c6VSa_13]MCZ9309252.1 acyl-CoA carboxylase subunit beta [Corynebacterium sp. c6VSa_13]
MTDLSTTAGKLADLGSRVAQAHAPAGDGTVPAARQRIESLVDAASFVEVDALARHRVTAYGLDATRPATDGVITGYATVDGRKVCLIAHDATIFDGRLGEVYGEKILKIARLARTSGVPLITFVEGAGARAAEGTAALSFYGAILREATAASGVIPQVAVVTGLTAGPHTLFAGLADIVIALAEAPAHLTAPETIATVTGTPCTAADFSAQAAAAHRSGADITVTDDAAALDALRDVLSYLPSNNRAEAPRPLEAQLTGPITVTAPALDTTIPDSTRQPFDARDILTELVDDAALLELRPQHGANLVTALARVEGRSVGLVANQPTELAGCLSSAAAAKAARFIRLCDAFNIPVVTVVDTPGNLPATEEELGGAAADTAALAAAYAEATVGLVTIVARKAMGAAGVAMGSKALGADLVFAWPTAQIAAAEAADAVPEIHARELAKAQRKGKDVAALTQQFIADYQEQFLTPYQAAERGMVDSVITPATTRAQLIEGLRLLDRKVVAAPERKHSTIGR